MNLRTTLMLILILALVHVSDARAQRDGARAGMPTVDEMADAVKANPEQRAALAEARLAWARAARSGEGREPGRGPAAAPLMIFLVESSRALDVEQTLALVDLLEETHAVGPRPHSGRRGGHAGMQPRWHRGDGPWSGRGGPGRVGDPLVDELDLTEQQRQQLSELREERRQERREWIEERAEQNAATRLEHLTALLDLDARQQEKVAAAMEAARRQLFEQRGDADDAQDTAPLARRMRRGREVRDATQDAIRDVLEPEQRELLARIQALGALGGPGPRGDRPGARPYGERRGAGPRGRN